jgi:hypothetical protein
MCNRVYDTFASWGMICLVGKGLQWKAPMPLAWQVWPLRLALAMPPKYTLQNSGTLCAI